jgi:hypothetical protein
MNANPESDRSAAMRAGIACVVAAVVALFVPTAPAWAWGGLGHRTVAAIAMQLLPAGKVQRMNAILGQLEIDNNFVDSASYPDEYIRDHDPSFGSWHFANLPDDGSKFTCGKCLFSALQQELAVVDQGRGDKNEAIALSWVIHLVGDLHQPLHMSGRLVGGNDFKATYRGSSTCPLYSGKTGPAELHSIWDDCLVEELAQGRSPQKLASDLLVGATGYSGRPELANLTPSPWLAWGAASHALANSVAFDHLAQGADLGDSYIVGPGKALDVAQQQLLAAGVRLAYLLDQHFK